MRPNIRASPRSSSSTMLSVIVMTIANVVAIMRASIQLIRVAMDFLSTLSLSSLNFIDRYFISIASPLLSFFFLPFFFARLLMRYRSNLPIKASVNVKIKSTSCSIYYLLKIKRAKIL